MGRRWMRGPRRGTLGRAAAALVVGLAGLAQAEDVVVKTDGKTYRGTIVSDDRRTIVMDTVLFGINTRLTIDRREVARVVRGVEGDAPVADATPPSADEKPQDPGAILNRRSSKRSDRPAPVKRDGRALVLEVPLIGGFGSEIFPAGIAAALEYAEEHGVTDVVFRIDSPGGSVWAAEAIMNIMEDHADALRYHMLIESAISASIWPTFSCDTISMAPGGTFGGAVVYRMVETGSAEVDMKMNSILAAELSALAEVNGHHPVIVKAMMLSSAQVWAAENDTGAWELFDRDPGLPSAVEIDGPDSVLTLTTDQAADYGIARKLDGKSLEDLGVAIELGPWDDAGDYGHEIVEKLAEKSSDLQSEIHATSSLIGYHLSRYNEASTWQDAIGGLNDAKKQLAVLTRLRREAEKLRMDRFVDLISESDNRMTIRQIDERLRRLHAIRRSRP